MAEIDHPSLIDVVNWLFYHWVLGGNLAKASSSASFLFFRSLAAVRSIEEAAEDAGEKKAEGSSSSASASASSFHRPGTSDSSKPPVSARQSMHKRSATTTGDPANPKADSHLAAFRMAAMLSVTLESPRERTSSLHSTASSKATSPKSSSTFSSPHAFSAACPAASIINPQTLQEMGCVSWWIVPLSLRTPADFALLGNPLSKVSVTKISIFISHQCGGSSCCSSRRCRSRQSGKASSVCCL